MGGSDQWGNITSGTELIRRKAGAQAHALTCPLLMRADGKKFGKTEGGESVWLDRTQTSPYKFYQYWLNCADEDAPKLLRYFTLFSKQEIEEIEAIHHAAPHERAMQKALAKEMTTRIHSKEDYEFALEASDILFGKGTAESLRKLTSEQVQTVFEGVPQATISAHELAVGVPLVDLVVEKSGLFPSRAEAKRMVPQGALAINKEKVTDVAKTITTADLLANRYVLLQKGKKGYCLVSCV